MTVRRILICDDERDLANLWGEVLKDDGHDVHVIYDSADCLDLFSQYDFDLMVLDFFMPFRNASFITHVASINNLKARVIVVTGDAAAYKREAALLEMDGFKPVAVLEKPLDVENLSACVRKFLLP